MHLKRLAASRNIRLPRRVRKYAITPMPGKHSKDESLPLGYVVRDILGYASSYKEARKVVAKRYIKIDKRVADNIKIPLGFMDVLEVMATGEKYRVSYNDKGLLSLVKIDEKEVNKKIGKIINKKIYKGGRIQITLHDGRNILLPYEEGNKYKVGDSLIISLPEQKILNHLPLKEGALVMVIRGKWTGTIARVRDIINNKGLEPNKINLELEDGKVFRTLKDYVCVIGEKEEAVSVR